MLSWREGFLKMPTDARHRYAELYGRDHLRSGLGRFPPIPKCAPRHSKQEMVEFAIRHRAYTFKEMLTAIHDFREENPPQMSEIIWLFGTYDAFRQELDNDPRCWHWSKYIGDAELALFCAKLKIRNSEQYEALRLRPVLSK